MRSDFAAHGVASSKLEGHLARFEPIPLFGHVGDGNFHCEILISPTPEAELEEAKAFNERVVTARCMEGTCTGSTASASADAVTSEGAGRSGRPHAEHEARHRPEKPDEPGKVWPFRANLQKGLA